MADRLAVPLRLGADGRFVTVEQDSADDVQQCIGTILQHRPGDRWDYPDMGIESVVFDESLDATIDQIAALVTQFEVRASSTASFDLEDHIATVLIDWKDAQNG